MIMIKNHSHPKNKKVQMTPLYLIEDKMHFYHHYKLRMAVLNISIH